MAGYTPGVCNIGPAGRIRRAVLGAGAIAVSLAAWGFLRGAGYPPWAVLLLFVPLFGGFVSLLEGALSFCVVYGERGVYDLR